MIYGIACAYHICKNQIGGQEMKTKKDLLEEIEASRSDYITYGDGDLGIPICREAALRDIVSMEEESIGDGDWEECDSNGNFTS